MPPAEKQRGKSALRPGPGRPPVGRPFTGADDPRRNRAGRPRKARCIPDLLRWAGRLPCPDALAERLYRMFPGLRHGLTLEQTAALAVYAKACEGDVRAAEYIAERTEGKVPQSVDLADMTPFRRRAVETLSDEELSAELHRAGILPLAGDPSAREGAKDGSA